MRIKLYLREHRKIVLYIAEIDDGGDIFEKIAFYLGMKATADIDPLWYMSKKGCVRWEKLEEKE